MWIEVAKFCKLSFIFICNYRPTSRNSGTGNGSNNGGLTVGIADDQAKDFDFEKTEMKYDSTGMFHWCPARSLEDCILVSILSLLSTKSLLCLNEFNH